MTIWMPNLQGRKGPLYEAIADAIAEDVSAGKLGAGERLPTQRDLAQAIGVALTTVTRGYTEAERRGLVTGEVGRGTFVRDSEGVDPTSQIHGPGVTDLAVNCLPPYPYLAELARSAGETLANRGAAHLMTYTPPIGSDAHRQVGARFLKMFGVNVDPDRVAITMGGQHAMLLVLSSLLQPGSSLLVEEVTYGGIKALAAMLHIDLIPVAMDADGLSPTALEEACNKSKARVLYCMANHQNPTGRVMSDQRRQEIAEIAFRRGLKIVEDDSYGFLSGSRSPLFNRVSGSYYINGTSKSVIPGLRLGFVATPLGGAERLVSSALASTWMPSAAMMEVLSAWMSDGTVERILAWKRSEATARNRRCRDILSHWGVSGSEHGQHVWIELPEPWRSFDFVNEARMHGIVINPAETYAVCRDDHRHFVRISLGSTGSREELEQAITTLAGLMKGKHVPAVAAV